MDKAMLLLGLILGCLAGLGAMWWFARSGPPLEPLFLRLLNKERLLSRIDSRIMLHELHNRVTELTVKVSRMDRELKELREKLEKEEYLGQAALRRRDKGNSISTFGEEGATGGQYRGVPATERRSEAFRLLKSGLSQEEVARRLQLSRGEVELLLSLGYRASWVLGGEGLKQGGEKSLSSFNFEQDPL